MTEAAGIEATGVVVDIETRLGTVRALEVDRFAVSAGTSVAVMGPSGCGKSTLLGLLSGLALPTRGTVTVDDVVLSSLPARDRGAFRRERLGMVYQADNLLPHLTVEENVGLALAVSGQDRGDVGVDCAAVLDQLGLADLRRRFPDQLSGGQRQRVAVARAAVHRPAVILADEPTGALDDRSRDAAIGLLIDAQRAAGATLVIVTHDPAVAAMVDDVHHLRQPVRPGEPVHAG